MQPPKKCCWCNRADTPLTACARDRLTGAPIAWTCTDRAACDNRYREQARQQLEAYLERAHRLGHMADPWAEEAHRQEGNPQ